jgi:hypothetical protein
MAGAFVWAISASVLREERPELSSAAMVSYGMVDSVHADSSNTH